MQYPLIWAVGGVAVVAGVVAALLRESRSRMKYTALLLCASLLIALLPGRTPWMDEAAIALAELAALHLFTILIFRVALRRFELPVIVSDFVVFAGYAVVLLTLLAKLGVNVPGLIATSAVLAAIIGLSFQDLLSNLIGGLSIQADGAIRAGQWIKCEHGMGRVLRVRLRCTSIETHDGDIVLIPNHALAKGAVIIFGSPRRILARFRLGPQHRPTQIIKAVERALTSSAVDGIHGEPHPHCFVMEHETQHIEYGVHVWMAGTISYEEAMSRVLNRIYFALRRANAPVASIANAVEVHNAAPGPDQRDGFEIATAALKKSPLWHSLTDDEVKMIAHRLKRSWFGPGEAIVKQGDAGSSMFVILHGSVNVMLSADRGAAQQIATLESGSFFGEMSLLTGDKRSASVVAIENVECGELDKEHVQDILLGRPELAREISETLEGRRSALVSAREKIQQNAEVDKRVDLLSRIQQFFGIARK